MAHFFPEPWLIFTWRGGSYSPEQWLFYDINKKITKVHNNISYINISSLWEIKK